ncbi:metallophosphoesterase family protein [Rhizobium sp. Leaf341]|uniref:metallophosphoesterase family protein n=1 Tax=Rhizobium sp. Leaf341 TaxID=1736344 RepID=UPI0007160F90|nr:metallophosphoesterase family protein [Rhizobium sp. Leaf341]KQR73410.1 metallophosphoesterase [Rhizobium sp. Leaf341]
MKIAVIADIHGNAAALEAVLADIDAQGIRRIVHLGDALSGPIDPARTAELLMARDLLSIRGNHDRALLTAAPDAMIATDRFTHAALSDHHFAWLESLEPTRSVSEHGLFLCHGTPDSDLTYWLEDVSPDGIVHRAHAARIEGFAAGIALPLLLCGHTHIPRLVTLSDGRMILNPGSVGCPAYADEQPVAHRVETGTPRASYAVVDRAADGTFAVAFRLLAYDHLAAAARAAANGRPDWARALATGWM